MQASLTQLRAFVVFSALGFGLATGTAFAADAYDAAVQHAGRSEADQKRDALDHPAEMLRLAGLKPGMKVADFLAGDGYYSELASYVVGPTGHVLLLNNEAFDKFSNNEWQARLAHDRLPNVEHRTVDLNHLELAPNSLDAVLFIKVYHDLYWVETDKKEWPDFSAKEVLDAVVKALKPGGKVLVIDHSAKAGTGSSTASSLHRIDEEFAIHDFESRGLKLVGKSDQLRNASDARDQITYKGPMVHKTDRFVVVFRKS